MNMRCLYCDKEIEKLSLLNLLEDDLLCLECRKALKGRLRRFKYENIYVYYLYEYDDMFKSILLQYKEVMDEALKEVFIYPYGSLFKILFKRYEALYVPSSKLKMEKRNFLAMEEIMKLYGAKKYADVLMRQELIQAGKSLKERRKMRDNYYLKRDVKADDYIMIIDDVFTSGSSISGMIEATKGETKHLIVFVLAVVK